MGMKPTYNELEQRIKELEKESARSKQIEEALRNSERELRLTLDATTDGIWHWNFQTSTFFFSPRFYLMVGYAPDEFPATFGNWKALIHPDDLPAAMSVIEKYLATKPDTYENEFRLKTKAGDYRWIHCTGRIVERDKNGEAVRIIGNHEDITERKRAENELAVAHRNLQNVMDAASQVAIIATDPDGLITVFNAGAEQMLGYSAEEIVGKKTPGIIHLPAEVETRGKELSEKFGRPIEGFDVFVEQARRGGFEQREWTYVRKDGSHLTVHLVVTAACDEDGRIAGFLGVAKDITERKKAEMLLKESEGQFRSIIENSKDGIIFFDGEKQKILYGNDAMAELLGCRREDLLGRSISSLHPSEEWNSIEQEFLKHVHGEISVSPEIPVLRHDGSIRYTDITSSQIILDGRSYSSGFFRDITERKRAEEKLRAAEETYRNVFLNAQVGMFRTDVKTGLMLDANDAVARFAGYRDRDEMLAAPFSIAERYVNPGDREKMVALLRANGEFTDFEAPFRRNDGSTILMRFSARLVPDKGWMEGVSVDVTRERQAEEALRESEKKYRVLVEAALESIFIAQEGMIKFCNKSFSDVSGYKLEDLAKMPFTDLIYPDDRQVIFDRYIQVMEGKEVPSRYTFRFVDARGNTRWADMSVALISWEGKPAALCLATDITERKKAEEELRRKEHYFRSLIENIADGIMVMNRDGTTLYESPGCLRQVGYTEEERVGHSVFELIHPDDIQAAGDALHRVLSGLPAHVELRTRHKDGSWRTIETKLGNMLDDPAVGGIVVNMRDITERKRAEEEREKLQAQLQRAQRMESIGTLAGGIAHDFNNILSVIIGNAEMALDDIAKTSPAYYCLGQITEASNRARDLVKQILAFSRQTEQQIKPVRVSSIVKETLKFLRSSLPATIQIRPRISSDPDNVLADPTQIHQMLMNLCTNALHAMGEMGGVLKVTLAKADVDSDTAAEFLHLQTGPYLKLSVSDTGHGMTPEVMAHIFDPYFTTKEKGVGTGLGLAVVHGIVRSLHGVITVQSEPGKGSTFEVFLPLAAEVTPPEAETFEPIPGGRERVLFVDDEEAIVDITKRMLQHLGYEVEVRTSSIEALEAFKALPDKFDLVITDMTMPNMTGDRLAKELIGIRPGIPIILCTGYSEKISKEKVKGMGIRGFVMKPIVMREIANTIREVLDKK